MKEYATKLTLYDFISMLMPGSIIVAVLMLLCTDGQLTLPNNAFFWVFFFISSYLAGIVNHIVTSSLSKFFNFRNCPKMLADSHQRAKDQGYVSDESAEKSSNAEKPSCNNQIYCGTALLGVCFGLLCCICSICKQYSPQIIVAAFFVFYIAVLLMAFFNNRKCDNPKPENLKDEYYKCYYYVKKNRYGNDIEVIESQVAFLQSLILPILLMLTSQCSPRKLTALFFPDCKYELCPCGFVAITLLTLAAIIVAIFLRQQKIYDRVWDDHNYLSKINEEELTKKNPEKQ